MLCAIDILAVWAGVQCGLLDARKCQCEEVQEWCNKGHTALAESIQYGKVPFDETERILDLASSQECISHSMWGSGRGSYA